MVAAMSAEQKSSLMMLDKMGEAKAAAPDAAADGAAEGAAGAGEAAATSLEAAAAAVAAGVGAALQERVAYLRECVDSGTDIHRAGGAGGKLHPLGHPSNLMRARRH